MALKKPTLLDSAEDSYPSQPLNYNADSLGAAGFYAQGAATADETVGFFRDVSHNLVLKDSAYPSGKTLTQLVAGGGTTTNALTFTTAAGDAGGTTFNGSAARSIGYQSVGAAPAGHTHSYQAADGDLLAIAGLAGLTGILRKTAADTWTLDNTIAITNGGTGAATRQAAIDALCGSVVNGTYPRGNGTNVLMSSLIAGDLTGTIPSAVLNNSTVYVGSTPVALNRATGALALTGITSIDGQAASVAQALTFNNLGTGGASGTTYNGGTAQTISYNTIGAAASGHNHSGVYEPAIAAGTTAQYWRGDKTWQTLPTVPTLTSQLTNDSNFLTAYESATAIRTKLLTVDGAGSGLDADLLDGASPATTANAGSIAQRDASGYLTATLFNIVNGTYMGQLSADATGAWLSTTGATSLRFYTNSAVRLTINSAGAVSIPGSLDVTGIVTGPTADPNTYTTQLATCEYVANQGYATADSPSFTGTPITVVPGAGDDSQSIPTTSWVRDRLDLYAPLASPVFTGNVGINATGLAALHVESGTLAGTRVRIVSPLNGSSVTSAIDMLRTGVAGGARIESARDVTNGGVGFSFQTTVDNAAEVAGTYDTKVTILPGGNVGIGATSPNEPFEIGGTGRAFFGNGGGANRIGLLVDGGGSTAFSRLQAYNYGTSAGTKLSLNPGGGNVGIGTTDPSTPLQVVGRITNTEAHIITASVPQAYTRYSTSLGDTYVGPSSNGGLLSGIADGDYVINSPGAIRLAAGGNTSKVNILSDGKVGIGGSPGSKLSVYQAASGWTDGIRIYGTTTTNYWDMLADSAGITYRIGYQSVSKLTIDTTGNVTATDFIATSDERLKENIETIPDALSKVLGLRGVNYSLKADETHSKKMGVIAQEVEKVIPEVVHTDYDTGMRSVSYGAMVGVLIEAVKEQNETIKKQQSQIDALMEMVKKLTS